jgi:hypothetical protein
VAAWQRGSKTQIIFTIAPALVDKLDAAAERRHVSRSALIDRLAQESA